MSLNRAKEFLDQSNSSPVRFFFHIFRLWLLGSHVFRIWKLTMTGKERLCITEFVCFLFFDFFFDRGLFLYIYIFEEYFVYYRWNSHL